MNKKYLQLNDITAYKDSFNLIAILNALKQFNNTTIEQ